MSVAEKFEVIADVVYEKGVADGKALGGDGVDWDIIQNKGNRQYWQNAFAYWGSADIDPKYVIKPTAKATTGIQSMFQGSYIERVNWDKFDLSECVTFYTAFNSCPFLVSVDIDLAPTATTANVWGYFCSGAQKLKRIQKMVTKLTHAYQSSFANCKELEEIRFAPYDAEKGIGIANDISFADSPKLTRESIVSILESLDNTLTNTKTLTFSTDLDFEGKLKDCVFGLIGSSGIVCENIMEYETGVINGLEYTKNGGEITLNGTATAETTINLSTTPIVFPKWGYYMSCHICDYYNDAITDYLTATIQKSDGTSEICYGAPFSLGTYESGNTITSIDLVIPKGKSFDNVLCGIGCSIDYLFWIEETLQYRNCWTLVY